MKNTDNYEIVRQKLTLGPLSADKHEKIFELMKIFWNKEEIEILSHFPNVGQAISIKELVEKTGKPKSHVKEFLKNAAKKKTIAKIGTKYGLVPIFPAILEAYLWAKQDTKENLIKAAEIFRYIIKNPFEFHSREEAVKRAKEWEKAAFSPILPLGSKEKLIEINETVGVKSQVQPYEILEEIINKNDTFAVVTCPCRLIGELSGEPCSKVPAEMGCLFMGLPAQLFIEKGYGRPLTKEETIEYLKKTEKAGLIHNTPGGSPEIQGFCNCCSCHCGIVLPTKEFQIKEMNPSNFAPKHNEELCVLCENCIEICPMEAISLQDEKLLVNYDTCLGCGVCASNCPENAIKMEKVRDKMRSADDMAESQKEYWKLIGAYWS